MVDRLISFMQNNLKNLSSAAQFVLLEQCLRCFCNLIIETTNIQFLTVNLNPIIEILDATLSAVTNPQIQFLVLYTIARLLASDKKYAKNIMMLQTYKPILGIILHSKS